MKLLHSKYYCPYCPPRYQFHKERSDGVIVCGQCGDPLIKVSLIRATPIFALIVVAAFIAPLSIFFFILFNEFKQETPTTAIPTMAILYNKTKNYSYNLRR